MLVSLVLNCLQSSLSVCNKLMLWQALIDHHLSVCAFSGVGEALLFASEPALMYRKMGNRPNQNQEASSKRPAADTSSGHVLCLHNSTE